MLPEAQEYWSPQSTDCGIQCRDHCSILFLWSLPCFFVTDPVLMWIGYCEALIPAFLWTLENFYVTAGLYEARKRYECAPEALTNHGPLAWAMKNIAFLKLEVRVSPTKQGYWYFKLCCLFQSFIWHKSKDKTDKHWALFYNSSGCFLDCRY